MMKDSISEDLPNPNNLKEQMKNANENNALNPFFKRVSAPNLVFIAGAKNAVG